MCAHRVSTAKLVAELRDHVGFMMTSAAAYDSGATAEAKRLAVELRVLLHDSLLENLGYRASMPLLDTCHPYSEDNAVPHYGLLVIRYADVLPVLDPKGSARRCLPWPEWSEAVVLSDGHGGTLSRLKLFRMVANKHGAHVALTLPPLYASLANSGSAAYSSEEDMLVFRFGADAPSEASETATLLPDPVAPSIRQLAHETLVSLALAHPEAFASASEVSAVLALRHPPFGLRGVSASRDDPLLSEGPLKVCVSRSVRSEDGETLG